MMLRGSRRHCPRCGNRRIFASRTRLKDRCPTCDLRFEKEEGGFLGAMLLNYLVAVVVWLFGLAFILMLTVPDVPVLPLLGASAVIFVAMPLWFYPRSKGLWAAIEFLVARSDPDYRSPIRRDPRGEDLE